MNIAGKGCFAGAEPSAINYRQRFPVLFNIHGIDSVLPMTGGARILAATGHPASLASPVVLSKASREHLRNALLVELASRQGEMTAEGMQEDARTMINMLSW
jgi:hypothetical protein